MKRLALPLAAMLLPACSCPPATCPPCQCPSSPVEPEPVKPTPASSDKDSALVVAIDEPKGPEEPADDTPIVVAAHSDWPQFQGQASRTGRSSAPAVQQPTIRWKTKVGIQGYLNAPLVSGSTVFVPSSGNTHNASDPRDGLFAIELATGRIRWHAHFANDANGASIVGHHIVATSDDGHVYGLDTARGTVVWKRKGNGKVYSHPTIIDELVVVGDAQGYVRAYAWADGTERWTSQMNGAIRGGLSSDGKHVFAVSQGGEAAAFSKTGRAIWRKTVTRPAYGNKRPIPIEGYAAPVVSGNTLVIPFARDTYYDDPAFVALDTRTGRKKWVAQDHSKESWGNVRSTPTLVDGLLIYAEPYSGDVAAIEASTGRVRYRRPVGACHFPQYASPAAAGDVVYVPRFDGALYAVAANSGNLLWAIYLGDAKNAGGAPRGRRTGCTWEVASGASLYAPIAIAADGTIIVGNGAGTVFALEGS